MSKPYRSLLITVMTSLCLAIPPALAVPTPPPSVDEINRISARFEQDGNHVRAVDDLRALAGKYAESKRDMWTIAQFLSWHESYLGNERRVLELIARHAFGNSLPPEHTGPPPEGATARPLARVIASLAENRQLVLINEAHHASRHRATTRSLLQPLHDAGFRYLALEVLDESGDALAVRGYPVAGSGSYLKDPVFGEMVREALRIGYTLVAYEPKQSRNQEEREKGQAASIAKVLEANPAARILVHAGYQHIEESGRIFGARTMAQHLQDMTGMNPLTLNQTTLTWIGDAIKPNAVYSAAMRLARGARTPFILQTGGDPWSLEPERYDVSVITPPSRYLESGRPGWLLRTGDRRPVPLSVPEGARLVEARLAHERRESIPVDRVEIRSRGSIALLLPEGEYRVAWLDADGEPMTMQDLRVNSD